MKTITEEIINLFETEIQEAQEDGIIFDVNIHDLGIDDVNAFTSHINANYKYEFYIGGAGPLILNAIDNNSFKGDELHYLKIMLNTFSIDCYIISTEWIELNIDPIILSATDKLSMFITFVSDITMALKKQVSVSAEGAMKPFITFSTDGMVNNN